jgi:rod shape determining protein RodA
MNASPIHKREEDQTTVAPRPPLLRVDWMLLLATLGLIVCSLITIGDATRDDVPGSPHYYLDRQLLFAGIGLILMFAISRVDYSRLRELKYGLYATMIASIVLVLMLGAASRGSRRSFDLAFLNFQPSELGKLLLVLALSAFVVDRVRRLRDRDTTARVMLLALVPAVFVMAQPDLGSSLVYIAIALAVLYIAGTAWQHFAALFALGAVAIALVLVAAPAAGLHPVKQYQEDRLTAFLHPSDSPSKQGYQQKQSQIAIGSGEKTGRGVANATQTGLDFLPEHHTDFIFAVVGETYGFAGCALVLSLYALMVWRGLHILTISKNLYGALIAGGVTVMLLFQLFVNVGMNVGIMPITGVTAPLLSYGGSSVLATFMALGLLHSIHAQARETAERKGRATVLQ